MKGIRIMAKRFGIAAPAIVALLLGTVMLVSGCNLFGLKPDGNGQTGSLRLTLAGMNAGSRSVVADPTLIIIDSYLITLESHDGHAVRNLTSSTSPLTVADLELGTWDIKAHAIQDSGIVAYGEALNQLVTTDGPLTVTINLSMTQDGTGGFSLPVTFPASTGIDYVRGTLSWLDGTVVGSPLLPAITAVGEDKSCVFAMSDVPSGAYILSMDFRRGGETGTPAGVFGEAVNVWDNVVSDRWVDPETGNLVDSRVFAAAEFFSGNANLSEVLFQAGGSDLVLDPSFTSLQELYSTQGPANPSASFTLKAMQSIAGQTLSYRINSGDWTNLINNTSTALDVGTGTSNITIRVLAPDRVTEKAYTFNLTWQPDTTPPDEAGAFTVLAGDDYIRVTCIMPADAMAIEVRLEPPVGGVVIESVQGVQTGEKIEICYPSSSYMHQLVPNQSYTVRVASLDQYWNRSPGLSASVTPRQQVSIARAIVMSSTKYLDNSVALGVTCSTDGSVYWGGYLDSAVYTSGAISITSNTSTSAFVAKSSNGTMSWVRIAATGSGRFDAVAATPDNGVVAVGSSLAGGITFTEVSLPGGAIIAQFTENGAIDWAKSYGDYRVHFRKARVDPLSGAIYVLGDIFGVGPFLFDGIEVTGASTENNSIILKFQSDGTLLWATTASSATGAWNLIDLAVNADGSVVVGGKAARLVFGAESTTSSSGLDETILASFNSDGVCQWLEMAASTSGSSLTALACDVSGGIVFFSAIPSDARNATFGFGETTISIPNATYGYGIISRRNPDGTVAWIRNGESQSIEALAIAQDGAIYGVGTNIRRVVFGNALAVPSDFLTGSPYPQGCSLVRFGIDGSGEWAVSNSNRPGLKYYYGLAIGADGKIYAAGILKENYKSAALVEYSP